MSELLQRTKNNIQDLLGYQEYPSDFVASHAILWTEEQTRCLMGSDPSSGLLQIQMYYYC